MTENEVIRGGDQKRNGRLRTLGTIYSDIVDAGDDDLAQQMLGAAPLLAPHIRSAADPWSARFQ